MVTNRLLQMLTARCLFSGLPSKDPHSHIAKVRAVCKSCVGRPDLDLDVIGLRVFPLSLTAEASIWFTELLYNSIFTRNQLRELFGIQETKPQRQSEQLCGTTRRVS